MYGSHSPSVIAVPSSARVRGGLLQQLLRAAGVHEHRELGEPEHDLARRSRELLEHVLVDRAEIQEPGSLLDDEPRRLSHRLYDNPSQARDTAFQVSVACAARH